MTARPAGQARAPALRPLSLAALLAALWSGVPAGAGPVLRVAHEAGRVVATVPLPEGAQACLHWAHSVTGGAVADCFRNRRGQLILARSFLHDFAAGLGTHPDKGTLVPAPAGGYWIEGLDLALPGNRLVLRSGSAAVGHRLVPEDGPAITLPLRTRLVLTLSHPDG